MFRDCLVATIFIYLLTIYYYTYTHICSSAFVQSLLNYTLSAWSRSWVSLAPWRRSSASAACIIHEVSVHNRKSFGSYLKSQPTHLLAAYIYIYTCETDYRLNSTRRFAGFIFRQELWPGLVLYTRLGCGEAFSRCLRRLSKGVEQFSALVIC